MSDWGLIKDLAAQVQAGAQTAQALVERSLATIKDGQEYAAIIATIEDRALARAKAIDQAIADGQKVGRLAGVPFIAKDNFLVFGAETTAASDILRGFTAPYQSTVIEKLEAEGAICVAKANLDAFAHGSSTENSDFMTTKNPYDKTRVPGGSSGGSAASVMLAMAPFALGTDTGGSIRLPASFTGAVGYKPTYGLVSRSGVIAMASSTDTIGPLTTSVEDAALIMEIISGSDPLDSTTIERDNRPYTSEKHTDIKGCKVGLVTEYMAEGVSDEVRTATLQAVESLKKAGAEIVDISLPSLPLALAVYYIICPAEVSSNLSRYDGQRYGFSDAEAENLEQSYSLSRGKGFGHEAKRRIMIGTYVLSSGYYDAYYRKAQTVRTKLINEFAEAFTKVDFLVGPVAPTTAFKIGQNSHDPLQMYLIDIMTVAASLVGNPAISVPLSVEGLPIGLQILAASKQDHELLQFAASIEGII